MKKLHMDTIKINYNLKIITLLYSILFLACKDTGDADKKNKAVTIDSLLQFRYQKILEVEVDSTAFPRSYTWATKTTRVVPSKNWTSGFYPGNLWYLYELTGNEEYMKKATEWTQYIEKEKTNDRTHDMGFKIFCSFGNALKFDDNQNYKDIIVESARTLGTRFNENVGSIRSWDFNQDIWEFPVIVDNMMNLELLFEASRISGDSTFHKMAVTHANTTLKNHFRPDNSSYHVVIYDTINGMVKDKVTHQGIADDSSWARGQGWGIYGYTMCYRYTKDIKYLEQAKASARFYLEHPNLPEDGIPYWDFDDPDANPPRDVSAGALIASAFYELDKYVDDPKYIAYANKVLNSLKTENYILELDVDAPFILNHSTGNWPNKDEIDEPIVYGDYYFLEALTRAQKK